MLLSTPLNAAKMPALRPTNKLKAHEYEYDSIVLGSDLRAVVYAYLNRLPLIFNKKEPPFSFEFFPPYFDVSIFDVHSSVIKLQGKTLGNSKLELWTRLVHSLSLSGLLPVARPATSLRVEDDVLKVFIKKSHVFRFKFNKLYVFDADNLDGISIDTQIKKYQVVDWMNVRSGCKHNHDYWNSSDEFVNELYFYPSERVSGDHNFKDVVSISYMTEDQLHDPNYGDVFVRFRTKKIMRGLGIKGMKNGKNPNYPHASSEPHKYCAVRLETVKREIRPLKKYLNCNSEKVVLLETSVVNLCELAEDRNSLLLPREYLWRLNGRLSQKGLMIS